MKYLLAAVLVCAVLPAAAFAEHRAGPRRHAAVVAAALAAHDIAPRQGPCARVWISSVSRRWAALGFPAHPSKRCARYVANGRALFHKRHRHWRFVAAGSAFHCPIRGVPRRVARELRVC